MSAFRYQHGDRPLEGFTIEHGVGRGGFGEVYYAISDAGRQVALKAVQNYEEVELRGIGHCMNLKSPHLVSVFDVKHNPQGQAFVIMEYVSGPNLRDLLDQSPSGLGPEKAAFFLREMAKGISYLHDSGIVHRDLKPHNVFYEEGYVKIGDYSLSKLMTASHRSGHTMTVGTVHYMAPEISKGRYGRSVDIYALGILLYEMLTGAPPFTGESVGEVLMKHMSAEVDVTGIEEPFGRVIRRALSKSPDERYGTAREMVEDLFGAEQIQQSVMAFDPQSLSIVAAQASPQLVAVGAGMGATEPFAQPARGPAEPPAHASSDSTSFAYQAGRAVEQISSKIGLRTRHRPESHDGVNDPMEDGQRKALALITALVMSVGVASLGHGSLGNPRAAAFYCFIVTLTAAMGLTLARRKLLSRAEGSTHLRRRMITLVHVAGLTLPVAFLLSALRRERPEISMNVIESTIGAGLVSLLIVDWLIFSSPARAARLSLPATLFVALVGAVGAGLADGIPLFGAGLMASIALTVQVAHPFSPRRAGQAARDNPDWLHSVKLARQSVEAVVQQVQTDVPADSEPAPRGSQKVPPEESNESLASPKLRLVTLVLASLFLSTGLGGLHRFYAGKIWTGMLWLATGGLFGIGQLIDAVMIALGVFHDVEGKPILMWREPAVADATRNLRAKPVNQYSTIPSDSQLSDGRRLTMGGVVLNLVGGLFLVAAIVGGFVAASGIAEAWSAGVFDELLDTVPLHSSRMSETLGMADWHTLIEKLTLLMACAAGSVSVVILIVARRNLGLMHMLRVVVACAGLALAVSMIHTAIGRVDWRQVADEVHSRRIGPAMNIFLNENQHFVPFVVGSAVCATISVFVLAWPAKRSLMAAQLPREVQTT